MRCGVAAGLVTAALGLAGAAAALFAPGCDGEPAAPGRTAPPPALRPPTRNYVFRWAGPPEDLPWNLSVYLTFTLGDVTEPPVPAIFDGTLDATISARPGSHWLAHSETSPNDVIERLLWTFRAEGTLGDEEVVALAAPQRARIRLTGEEATDPGADQLSVVDESSGARLAAVRDPLRGLHFGVWDAAKPAGQEDWRTFRHAAPTRPWTLHELRPGGTFVIAARSGDRHWVARRVTLAAGDVVTFDVAARPRGGGRVVCEDPGAHLLLDSDLPVAPIRTLAAFYRAAWDGVPPGRHAVRYADGTVVPIDVADGAEVKLPRR